MQHVCLFFNGRIIVGLEKLRGGQAALQFLPPRDLLDGDGNPQPEPELELSEACHYIGKVSLGKRRIDANN
jgi:hypothetical protein